MGYLSPDFDYDLFISYAHADLSQTGVSPLKTWSQVFAAKLVEELRLSLESANLACFLDENRRPGLGIDPTRSLTPQLEIAIRRSGLLVLLMSPFYLKSEWCKREVDGFVAEAQRRQRGDGLLFVVRIWPTEAKYWPPPLKGEDDETLPGFWFYDRDLAKERPRLVRPFGWEDPRQHDRAGAFREALADIVDRMAVRLEELHQKLEKRQVEAEALEKLAETGGQTLYLYSRNTHRDHWQRAYDELERAGFTVFPSEPDPDPEVAGPEREAEAARERIDMLRSCDALVLLRSRPGRSFDMDLAKIGMRDRRNARESQGGSMPCAVINLCDRTDPEDRQRRIARSCRIEWVEGNLPDWPSELRRRFLSIFYSRMASSSFMVPPVAASPR
jgi:hypothetical protein